MTQLKTVKDIENLPWEKLGEKVGVKHLSRVDSKDFQMDILKLEPNTEYPEHGHADVEWVYVLKGSFTDKWGTYNAGDFHVNEKNSRHSTHTGPEGAELLVGWCGRFLK